MDPKEELVAVYMSQAPSPFRAYYRRLVKQLVYRAIADEGPERAEVERRSEVRVPEVIAH